MCRHMRWEVFWFLVCHAATEAPSILTAAYDPRVLPEQETPLEIGRTWFLDQDIPAGGFVRIQDSSQVWEEREDETRIITTEGLTTCLDQDEDGQSLAGDGTF